MIFELILNNLYNLSNRKIKIWSQNKKIKIFVPNNVIFNSDDKKFIQDNKSEILNFLESSKIYTDKYEVLILRSNLNFSTLSFGQKRLWFIEKYEGGTNAYNIPILYKIRANTEISVLEESLKSIVARHEILRTLVKEDEESNVYQLVLDNHIDRLTIQKIRFKDKLDLEELVKFEINHIYDLSKEIPIRVCLYQHTDNDEKYLSIVIHHIAFDGWSADIFLRELQEYYTYHLNRSRGIEAKLNLPELNIQYKDFALWQKSYLTKERLNKQLIYWKNKLDGYETLNLITDKVRPSQVDYTGKDIYFEIDESTSVELRQLAKELKVSLYSLLLGGYYLMLRVFSNQDNIVIGTAVANRHYPQLENLIGFFVNTLALSTHIKTQISVKEFIQRIGKEVVDAQLNQDLPFEKLVEELDVIKDTSRHPIFQVMFGVQGFWGVHNQNSVGKRKDHLASILEDYTPVPSIYNVARFDISTFIDDSQMCLKGSFNYAVSLYTEGTITRFVETYIEILRQLGKLAGNIQLQEHIKLAELTYLSQTQYHQIIHSWNQTDKAYQDNKTIHQLFEEQVEKTPDNIAVVYEGRSITYRELNERTNQLGNYLRKLGVGLDTVVAIILEHSIEVVVGILGILKAGAAYVPLDPNSPTERLQFILNDTKAPVILTKVITEDKIPATFAQVVFLDEEWGYINKYSSVNFISSAAPDNLAYVIYTSGTTGNPKGVMIKHNSVVNYTNNSINKFCFSQSDKHLMVSEYIFDLGYTSLWGGLLSGGKLYALSRDQRFSLDCVSSLIKTEQISVIKTTPLYFKLLIDYWTQDLSKLTNNNPIKVILGGERLTVDILDWLAEANNSITLYNHYGPTETTIGSITCQIDYRDSVLRSLFYINAVIGSIIMNVKCYTLDINLNPVPIGAIGELYIGGVGLARGYLNKPELTADKFIANPFQTDEERADKACLAGRNARLYKTGDLVRWLPNGNLEYIGRNDFQVKIRGYRIELGEIESLLSNYKGIVQSVVLAKERAIAGDDSKEGSNKYLVGYYVSEDKLDKEEILRYLQTKLPDYMVPSILMHLDKLPLTINGKLDRKSLPDPEFTSIDSYVGPRNDLERQVCTIWSEILGLAEDKVGIYDDFFKLGGDSILAIKLVSKMSKELNTNISIASIFKTPTIEGLIHSIKYINKKYNLIVKLNSCQHKFNIFMIHPGESGCEVYIPLAKELNNYFSCYGVDSYNLYNNPKIRSFAHLSNYYLNHIQEVMLESQQKDYYLLGWSLGGKIALKIASILEAKGIKKIKVYLLDTILNDNHSLSFFNKYYSFDLVKKLKHYLYTNNYDKSYIRNYIANFKIEQSFTKQKILPKLQYTKVILFKAMKKNTSIQEFISNDLYEYFLSLEYNNIDLIMKNPLDIKLINLHDSDHNQILSKKDFLTKEILSKC